MTKDLNKGIGDIQYNSLNLPRQMVIISLTAKGKNYYTYSASGMKLRTEQRYDLDLFVTPLNTTNPANDGLSDYKNTDYAGNIIYETVKSLSTTTNKTRILFDGGYIEDEVYHYYLTDHQGNNRLVVNSSGTVVQKNHYYPFGMAFAETPVAEQGKQPYKYNGKELDRMHELYQYDYSARYYDPAIAQFTTIDPLAEKYYNTSPYVYCKNNPINRIDPDGRDDYFNNKGIFLRRDDKKTDFIWIENKAKDGIVSTTAITETRLSNNAIKSVVGHYNSQLDKSDRAMPEVKIETSYADDINNVMRVPSSKPTTIQVNYRRGYEDGEGKVNTLLNTVANMENSLVHERKHVKQNNENDKKGRKERELEAINTQREHSTWDGTTDEFKKNIKGYEDRNK